MGRFDGVNTSKFNAGGVYFEEGEHLVRIEKVHMFDGRNDEFFIVESTILESTSMKPGQNPSVMYKDGPENSDQHKMFLGNVGHFASVATECDISEVDAAGVEALISSENPLRGELLRVSAKRVLKKNGDPTKSSDYWTKIVWQRPKDEDLKKYAKAA